MNADDVRYVLDELFAAWPRVPAPSPRTRKAWGPALEQFGVLECQVAIQRLAEANQYLPSLAEFIAMVKSVRLDAGISKNTGTPPVKEYGHNVGVRAPCDDELDDDKYAEATKVRGKMVGDR